MSFTTQNTDGYTQAELDALNAELAERLAGIPADDTDRAASGQSPLTAHR